MMKIKTCFFGQTLTVHLQGSKPKCFREAYVKSKRGSWVCYNGDDLHIWVSTRGMYGEKRPLHCVLDTWRHEAGHVMRFLQYRYNPDVRENGEADADVWSMTLREYDRVSQLIEKEIGK
jgi:hypothetical protein